MVYAKLYRMDLISGDHIETGWVIVGRGSLESMHTLATQAAKRKGAEAYRLFEGPTMYSGKPLSLHHSVK